jgi:hypothetical protein
MEKGEGQVWEDVVEAELGVLLETVSSKYKKSAIANIHC